MPEEALRETAHELLATCCELVEILLHEQLPDVFLERTFTNATALAAKCGTPHAKDNLRNLRRQWEERGEAQRARRAVGDAAPAQQPAVVGAAPASELIARASVALSGEGPWQNGKRASPAASYSSSQRARRSRGGSEWRWICRESMECRPPPLPGRARPCQLRRRRMCRKRSWWMR
mmetsp:Transcript_6658/g.17287  ORF Transcript_6658/g.17287 Transcript_6658/m.17287 type:complete len:177 (-) Transcript_6658:1245-1775(-)